MRESLENVVRELDGWDDPERVREAARLQDELREAMMRVATIRAAAAASAIQQLPLEEAARRADSSPAGLQSLAEGGAR